MAYLFENESANLVCGVDEAGRGPLAGPVVAAAVILDKRKPIIGLKDSKKLTERQREKLSKTIMSQALCWNIAEGTVQEIEQYNILEATMMTMKRAVMGLSIAPDLVLIDGNRVPELPYRAEPIVKGDDLIEEISAASILAKVYRDNLMKIFATMYPRYGFEKHNGYGTELHIKMLKKWGPCPIHRLSFEPVATINKQLVRKSNRAKRKSI